MIAIKPTVLKLISQKVPLELIKLERQFENATKQFSRYRMFLFINNYYWTKLYHLLYRYTFVDQYIIKLTEPEHEWNLSKDQNIRKILSYIMIQEKVSILRIVSTI